MCGIVQYGSGAPTEMELPFGASEQNAGLVRPCDVVLVMQEVIVYSRRGCHLCDEVKAALRRLERRAEFRWREVDIDTDPELQKLYTDEVPVVLIDGAKAFKYRLDEREFLKKLKARS